MKELFIETGLSVEDYVRRGDYNDQDAFTRCGNSLADARDQVIGEVRDALHVKRLDPRRVSVHDVKFVEFDSNSITHAAGYFKATLRVTREEDARVLSANFGLAEAEADMTDGMVTHETL